MSFTVHAALTFANQADAQHAKNAIDNTAYIRCSRRLDNITQTQVGYTVHADLTFADQVDAKRAQSAINNTVYSHCSNKLVTMTQSPDGHQHR